MTIGFTVCVLLGLLAIWIGIAYRETRGYRK